MSDFKSAPLQTLAHEYAAEKVNAYLLSLAERDRPTKELSLKHIVQRKGLGQGGHLHCFALSPVEIYDHLVAKGCLHAARYEEVVEGELEFHDSLKNGCTEEVFQAFRTLPCTVQHKILADVRWSKPKDVNAFVSRAIAECETLVSKMDVLSKVRQHIVKCEEQLGRARCEPLADHPAEVRRLEQQARLNFPAPMFRRVFGFCGRGFQCKRTTTNIRAMVNWIFSRCFVKLKLDPGDTIKMLGKSSRWPADQLASLFEPRIPVVSKDIPDTILHDQEKLVVVVEPRHIGRIIGPRGSTFKLIGEVSGILSIDLNSEGDPRTFELQGDPVALDRAKSCIDDLQRIGIIPQALYQDPVEETVRFDTLIMMGACIGRGGRTRRALQEHFRVTLISRTEARNEGGSITVIGDRSSVQACIEAMEYLQVYRHHDSSHGRNITHMHLELAPPDIEDLKEELTHINRSWPVAVYLPTEKNPMVLVVGKFETVDKAADYILKRVSYFQERRSAALEDKDWAPVEELERQEGMPRGLQAVHHKKEALFGMERRQRKQRQARKVTHGQSEALFSVPDGHGALKAAQRAEAHERDVTHKRQDKRRHNERDRKDIEHNVFSVDE